MYKNKIVCPHYQWRDNVKKLILFLTVLMLTACSLNIDDIDNTPTKKVEEYLNNYQSLSSDVVNDLDIVVERETTFNL